MGKGLARGDLPFTSMAGFATPSGPTQSVSFVT